MAGNPSHYPPASSNMHQFGFQVTEAAESKPSAVESPATLLIKHLPEAIPHETLSRLLSHFGAYSVRPCTSGRYLIAHNLDFLMFFCLKIKL